MLTRASLKNPYAVFAICMIVLVLGAVSYQKMRVDIFPEIKIPTILVTTFYRGLSPSEMEAQRDGRGDYAQDGAAVCRSELRRTYRIPVARRDELHQSLLPAGVQHRFGPVRADQPGLQHHSPAPAGRLSPVHL
ncbi:MAG: efflux RND transporter permease subunit [Nitrospirae bacterium]|nr:MAG: efflux RND transporter permease subunit [Nitrospirota bacterium]